MLQYCETQLNLCPEQWQQSIGGGGLKYDLTRYLKSERFRVVVTHM